MFLHGTSAVNENGHLQIGGVNTIELAKQYGTPLFVYDVALIRERAHGFQEAFRKEGVTAQVAYASKAFSCIAMFQLVEQLGLSLDVVSGGELYTALQAGFPMNRVHFHGNNKSEYEIEMALDAGIGCFVVDNFYELGLIESLCGKKGVTTSVLLRTTPGIEAHTHDYISTGQEDSKFGFDMESGQIDKAITIAQQSKSMKLLGLHCHIGSQIFDTQGFIMAIEKIFSKVAVWKDELHFTLDVLNLGGGFGIRYVEGDEPLPPAEYVRESVASVKREAEKIGIAVPEIWIEPGRSLVGDAGTTLYKIGSDKNIPNIRHYLAVDGGMSDNIRPALYEAKYEAAIANRMNDEKTNVYSIAGKCCESGDMLMWDLPLPEAESGDILAMFCTGAYGYAMASNYNRIPRPAIVFVEDGEASLVVQRESYEDIVKNDLPLKAVVEDGTLV